MGTLEPRPPIEPGQRAPDFTLPAADREGSVSLADYRGKSPLFLALFRGVYCPFCRRAIAQMGAIRDKLRPAGVETLGIVATTPDNARLYFRYRPARVPLAADPDLSTHRAYGIPRPLVTPELMQAVESVRINPGGALPEPLPIAEAGAALNRLDRFEPTETDRLDEQRQFPQLVGEFLIDREGIVRWVDIECAREGVAGLGKFPTAEEVLAEARALAN